MYTNYEIVLTNFAEGSPITLIIQTRQRRNFCLEQKHIVTESEHHIDTEGSPDLRDGRKLHVQHGNTAGRISQKYFECSNGVFPSQTKNIEIVHC